MQGHFLLINGSREPYWLQVLQDALTSLGVLHIGASADAIQHLLKDEYDSIIVDATAVDDAPALVTSIRARRPSARVVVVTASPTWRRAREAFQAGAVDYIPKSMNSEDLRSVFASFLVRNENSPPLPNQWRGPTMTTVTILFADNDPSFLKVRKEFLEQEGYEVLTATTSAEARRILNEKHVDLALLDIRLENDNDEKDLSGLMLAQEVARSAPKILLTGFPSYEYVREALRPALDGLPAAVGFIAKQEGWEAMSQAIRSALFTRGN